MVATAATEQTKMNDATTTTTEAPDLSKSSSSSSVLSSALELTLRKQFPNNSNDQSAGTTATDDEIIRFSKSAEAVHSKSKKKNKDVLIEELAVHKLEEYLDWRQCYGLDYVDSTTTTTTATTTIDDATIWKWALRKAVAAEQQQKENQKTTGGLVSGFFGSAFGGGGATKSSHNDQADDTLDTSKKTPGTVDYDAAILKASSEDEDDLDGTSDNKEDETKDSKEPGKNDADTDASCKAEKPDSDDQPLQPQIIFKRNDSTTGDVIRDKTGTPILHVTAARIDRSAVSAETLALAVALYLERHFDRSPSPQTLARDNSSTTNNNKKQMGNVTLMVDLRGGKHFPNPKAIMLLTLIRKIVHSIGLYHPGRITSLIIYPLPKALLGVWNSAKGYFGPDVVESFHLVSGPSKPGSPLPKAELEEFVDGDVLDFTEKCREELDVPTQ